MNSLTIFEFESKEVRFVGTTEKLEWVALDIVAILYPQSDKRNYSNYLKKVRPVWKGNKKIMTPGGEQEVVTLFEPGFYQLLGRSNSAIAEKFQVWLYEEVIPSIRKTGNYSIHQQQPLTQIQVLAAVVQQMAEQEQRLLEQEKVSVQVQERLEAVEAEQDRYSTPSGHKYTVMGYARKQGIEISAKNASSNGRKASTLCRKNGLEVERIYDPRFGQVGLYPESVLLQVFAE